MYRVLKEDLRKRPYKMMKRYELTEHHDRMRAERSRYIPNDNSGLPKSLQQNSAPSHGSNVTQTWIQRNISSFISKDVWPARRPDLNPLDFSIWSVLETRVFATTHTSLESLKAKLQREWEAISQEQICAACDAFVNILKAVVRNNGGYIEKCNTVSFPYYSSLSFNP
ncbi:hypothetical protein FHG87_001462 [Trinorchestia longiramus]|nr:hypothetical protein FHG87_001462 [Trinorchestia longiramus]